MTPAVRGPNTPALCRRLAHGEVKMSDFNNMGNDEIGQFCLIAGRKLAKDIHTYATGIKVVHQRMTGKRGEFGAWRKKYVFFLSKATVYRYLAVAEIAPEAIGKDKGLTDLYRRLHILPAKPPAPSPPSLPPEVTRQTPGGGGPTACEGPIRLADLVRRIASQPGAKKQGLTPAVLARMPEDAVVGLANQLRLAPAPAAGVTTGDDAPCQGVLPAHAPTEEVTPEAMEVRRGAELSVALRMVEQKAKLHGLHGTPEALLAFLGEFGVRPEDIAARNAA